MGKSIKKLLCVDGRMKKFDVSTQTERQSRRRQEEKAEAAARRLQAEEDARLLMHSELKLPVAIKKKIRDIMMRSVPNCASA